MLTFQQIEMYGKLQPLIKKYKDHIGESNVLTDGQLYFNYLLQKYLSDERFERAAFERRTGVGKNVYYKLSGISKETKDKPVKAETLFDVVIVSMPFLFCKFSPFKKCSFLVKKILLIKQCIDSFLFFFHEFFPFF